MRTRLAKLYFVVPIVAIELTTGCLAAVSVSNGDIISINFGGDIEPVCKVRNNVKNRALNIDLTSATRQNTNNVLIWCNTGQSNAQTTYESLNGGNLVNENGNTIPYLIQINQTLDNSSLSVPQTVSQRAGSGVAGSDKGRIIRVIPQVTGFEFAGTYRDTIQVTVAVN